MWVFILLVFLIKFLEVKENSLALHIYVRPFIFFDISYSYTTVARENFDSIVIRPDPFTTSPMIAAGIA